jgi:hypothetical protein
MPIDVDERLTDCETLAEQVEVADAKTGEFPST